LIIVKPIPAKKSFTFLQKIRLSKVSIGNKNLLPLIESLRYSGAIMVMLFHVMFFPSGYKGVDLFFVISGFVLYYRYMSTSAQDEPIAVYFVRRVSKIYLLYWTAVGVYLLTARFTVSGNYTVSGDFWKTLLLWPPHRSIVGISWSLSYELYFYALFGLLLFIKRPPIRQLVAVLILVISTTLTIVNMTTPVLKGSALNFLLGHNVWEFMLGLTAGYLMKKRVIRGIWPYLLFMAGFLTLCFLSLPFRDSASAPLYGLCSFVAVYGAACIAVHNKAVSKVAGVLGRSSYAIYLFHPLFMPALAKIGLTYPPVQVVLITGLSIVINRFYEEPFLRVVRRVSRRLLVSYR
jgi:peptidoglycan/LPS O-acetylase OafA/YrhL